MAAGLPVEVPIANGTLTAVSTPGAPQDFEDPAGEAAVAWSGEEAIWVSEQLIETVSGGELNEVTQTRVLLSGAIPIARESILAYQHAAASHTRRVRDIAPAELLGLQRVHLWDV